MPFTTYSNTTLSLTNSTTGSSNDSGYSAGALTMIIGFPLVALPGTCGNLLIFVVMQRGSLKHSSTCFYMAMLAVADTGRYITFTST